MNGIPAGPLSGTVVDTGETGCVIVLWPAPGVAVATELPWPVGSRLQAQYAYRPMIDRVKERLAPYLDPKAVGA